MSDYPTLEAMFAEVESLLSENESLKIRIQELETRPVAASDNRPKLTAHEVKVVRELFRAGESQADIADIFDLNPSSVCRIVRGQAYRSTAA